MLRICKVCRLSKLCKIYKNKEIRAGEVAQLVEFLPSIHVTLGSIPALHKSGLVTPPYSPNTPERYSGEPEFKVILSYSKFHSSLTYVSL